MDEPSERIKTALARAVGFPLLAAALLLGVERLHGFAAFWGQERQQCDIAFCWTTETRAVQYTVVSGSRRGDSVHRFYCADHGPEGGLADLSPTLNGVGFLALLGMAAVPLVLLQAKFGR